MFRRLGSEVLSDYTYSALKSNNTARAQGELYEIIVMNCAAMLIMIIFGLLVNGEFQRMLVKSATPTNRPGRAVSSDYNRFVENANVLEENIELHKRIIYEADLAASKLKNITRNTFRWGSTSPKPTVSPNSIYNVPVNFRHKEKVDTENDTVIEEKVTLTVTGVGKRLLLSGCQPLQLVSANAMDYVRDIITEHLESINLASQVVHAQRLEEGILFEMNSTDATVEVLDLANVQLQGACFHIDPSNADFVAVNKFIRFGA